MSDYTATTDENGVPTTLRGVPITESPKYQRAMLLEVAKGIQAVGQAAQFEVAEMQKQLVKGGMQLAAAVQITQAEMLAKYMPRFQQQWDVMQDKWGIVIDDFSKITDAAEILDRTDRISRIDKRAKESLKIGIECMKELATPAIPDMKIAVNVDARVQPDRKRNAAKDFAEFVDADTGE